MLIIAKKNQSQRLERNQFTHPPKKPLHQLFTYNTFPIPYGVLKYPLQVLDFEEALAYKLWKKSWHVLHKCYQAAYFENN